MKYKKILSLVVVGILTFSIVSCGTEENKTGEGSSNIAVDSNESGREVIVATSVAVVQILDALGVKVSGVPTSSYELPESTKGAVEVGNPMSPDLEIIKSLNPIAVISVDTLGSDYMELFTENNIPSEFVNLESLDGLKETITILGKKFDKNIEAEALLAEIVLKEEEVKTKALEIENPEIMIIFAAPGSSMLATAHSYIGNLVQLVGGNNVIEESKSSFVNINKEELVKLNPDKILVMTHALPEQTKAALQDEMTTDAVWQRIEAVKEDKVVYLDSNYFGMSANLKVVEALDILFDIVHDSGE